MNQEKIKRKFTTHLTNMIEKYGQSVINAIDDKNKDKAGK